MLGAAQKIAVPLMRAENASQLDDVLQEACDRIGCRFFALSHHIDLGSAQHAARRLSCARGRPQ
jgi:LuxR family quorum-sensing system transcriptional regulator CciR